MIGIRLTAGTGDAELISFLLSELEGTEYRMTEKRGKFFISMQFFSEEEGFLRRFYSVLANGIRLYYKYEFLKTAVSRFSNEYRYHALLGVMIGVDSESEERYILRALEKTESVCLPQLKHFELDRLFGEWQAFADFVGAFRREDWDDKRAFYEMIPVLQILGLNEDQPKNEMGISLDGETGELYEGDRKISVMKFTDNPEYNLLTMITAVKPDTVTVTSPKRLSSEILDVLKEMGQAEKSAVNN